MRCEITTNEVPCGRTAHLYLDGLNRCFEHRFRSNRPALAKTGERPITDDEAGVLLADAFEKLSGDEPEVALADVAAAIDARVPRAPVATRARDRVFEAIAELIAGSEDEVGVTELRVALREYRERCPSSYAALELLPFAGDLLKVIDEASERRGSVSALYGLPFDPLV